MAVTGKGKYPNHLGLLKGKGKGKGKGTISFIKTRQGSEQKALINDWFFNAVSGSSFNGTPGVGAITLTGLAPSINISDNKNVQPDTGLLSLTGYSPTINVTDNKNILVGYGTCVLTGFEPVVSVTNNANVSANIGIVLLSGFSPTVSISSSTVGTYVKRKRLKPRMRTRGYRK